MAQAILALDPAFGGTRFGPFGPGPVLLGSDGARCTLALSAALGVLPVHAQVGIQPDGSAWIQPVEQAGGVWLHAAGRRPERLTGAAALRHGDGFSLGSEQGIRFFLEISAALAGEGPVAPRRSRPADRLSAASFAAEIRRQADATAQTLGPVAELRNLGFRARSGALFQPRVVVGLAVGVLGAAIVGCGGLFATLAGWLDR